MPGSALPRVTRLYDRLRGRANSLAALSQSLAFIICPALATGFIAAGAAAVWIGLLCAGCLATVAVGARLRRALTSDQDHVTEAPATRPEPVAGRRRTGAVRDAWLTGLLTSVFEPRSDGRLLSESM